MKDYKKPLPRSTPWSKPFWEGCRAHKLLIQKCRECDKFILYPKLFCPYCLSTDVGWAEASGKGTVYSFSIVHSYAPTEFAEDIPYMIAIIDLKEGVRLMSNIVDCPLEKLECGMDVEETFDDIGEQHTLPKFKPA